MAFWIAFDNLWLHYSIALNEYVTAVAPFTNMV